MDTIIIQSDKPKQVIDITDKVQAVLSKQGIETGLINLFVKHTTAALTTADLDPGTDLDMLDAFQAMVPKLKYRHPHDPGHVPDHILSALIGNSVTIPIENRGLSLGQWQRVILVEFSGPRERQILLTSQNI